MCVCVYCTALVCTSKSLHTHHDSFAVIVDTDSIVRVCAAALNASPTTQRPNERTNGGDITAAH